MILTKTTELAIQSLIFLTRKPKGYYANPQEVADLLGESASYIGKVLRLLAKSALLKSHRGIAGGFELARDPDTITLLEVTEICQGTIIGNYCREVRKSSLRVTCEYHRAMHALQDGIRGLLSEWTIGRIADAPPASRTAAPDCKLRVLLGP